MSYTPGQWVCLVRSGMVAFLPPLTPAERIERVWAALGAGEGLALPFKEVRAGYMEDLDALPAFALVSVTEGVHLILRGPVQVQVPDADGVTVSGEGLTTWCERLLPGAQAFDLTTADKPSADTAATQMGQASFWLESGAVLAAGIRSEAFSAGGPEPRPPAAESYRPATLTVSEPDTVSDLDTVSKPVTASADTIAPPASADTVLPNPDPEPADPEPAGPATAPVPTTSAAPAVPRTPQSTAELIDSVPWLRARTPDASADASAADDTIAHPGSGSGAPPATAEQEDGDTVMRSDLPARPAPAVNDAPSSDRPATGPVVLARTCPDGHANPPTHSTCSVCGAELQHEPASTRRPTLGTLRVSSGQVIPLDRNVVVGRQPSASRVQSGGIPRLIPVRSDSGDISRSHVEVRLEGWHVMLCDLNSTNGTILIREGQLSRRLGRGESAILLDGDIADLGDGVTLTFEGLV